MRNSIGNGRGIGGALRHALQGENFIRHVGNDKLIFDFHEGQGTKVRDKSHCGNDGTLGSGATKPTWKRNSLYFDGGDYVDCGNDTSLLITGALTIEVLFKPDTVPVNGSYIVTNVKGVNTGYGLYIYDATGSNLGHFRVNGLNADNVDSVSALTISSWNSFIATYNLSALKIYLEGAEDNSVSATGSIDQSNNDPVNIGRRESNNDYWTKGHVKFARILNKALSGIECQNEYLAQKFSNN